MSKTVLFLCTGNYFRSRFAEAVFDAGAKASGLDWRSFSRGLALERGLANVGPVSPHVVEALRRRGLAEIDRRAPLAVVDEDFARADRIIALSLEEHAPLVLARHRRFANRVEYWKVDDVDPSPAYDPLARVEAATDDLIAGLLRSTADRD